MSCSLDTQLRYKAVYNPFVMYRQRYRRIVSFFARMIVGFAIWDIALPRIGLRKLSQSTRTSRLKRSAIEFRELAIEMGGVMIKVGQFLSTRVDVLPVEFTSELMGLQDEVPEEDFEDIRQVAEAEYGVPLSEKFVRFDPKPLAAASLGQVHHARIRLTPNAPAGSSNHVSGNPQPSTGSVAFEEVVVKIQRPDIEAIIKTDLSALYTIGNWLNKYPPISRRADINALLDEFSNTLFEEIDYIAEGQNADKFAENFKYQSNVRVPAVVWSHTTRRVLALENVWGIKITDYDAISAAGIDRADVASRLIDTYLKQIFEDGFFHADPHPGNLFVNPIFSWPPFIGDEIDPSARQVFWQLTFVDFGMAGHVSDNMRGGLRDLVIGVGTRNASRLTKAYQNMGILLPGADLELIEEVEVEIFDRFWGMSMTELSQIGTEDIYELTREYRELLYSMPFQIPQNLIFLGRTFSILSGICTGLDPEFNIFEHIAPYAQKLLVEEAKISPSEVLAKIEVFARTLYNLPGKTDALLDRIERGEIEVRNPEVSKQVKNLESAVRQIVWGIVFASLLFGGIQLRLGGEDMLASVMLAGALISLIIVLVTGRRNK